MFSTATTGSPGHPARLATAAEPVEADVLHGRDQEFVTGDGDVLGSTTSASSAAIDYTKIPGQLDKAYGKFDADNALRGTIITPKETWMKKSQKALLNPAPVTNTLHKSTLETEKSAAFDLLDALSRSGALTVEDASLHVVMAATHRFDQTLMDTIVQKNVNPIERVERSALIMAATIHNTPAREVILDAQVRRVSQKFPTLVLN